jgi:histidine triad (HIT) family protein
MSASKGPAATECVFCRILDAEDDAGIVRAGRGVAVLLDHRPLFRGHCLVMPREHLSRLEDLPPEMAAELFEEARTAARAVRDAMEAEGTFLAANDGVSQSVPHVHVHVVPRRKGDGLKGFFWPRTRYTDAADLDRVREAIRRAFTRIAKPGQSD